MSIAISMMLTVVNELAEKNTRRFQKSKGSTHFKMDLSHFPSEREPLRFHLLPLKDWSKTLPRILVLQQIGNVGARNARATSRNHDDDGLSTRFLPNFLAWN